MAYTCADRDGVAVLQVDVDRLDASEAPAFKRAALEAVDLGVTRMVVDLSRVSFIDSSGLSALLSLRKNIDPAGSVVLAGVHAPKVVQLFRVTRLDQRVFPMYADAEQAVAALAE
ncbi:STAS domain-containing protein [Halorhodospira halophila]|uniref:Anti-sigma-factor antagonist n=1 Tax=Halorhodospira halophila (strain DSM 244 / SL1) TaxID=349124 RepID=A1WTI6_HALHL|nr:STAS domain-containing protein [Halorhodospira halophila]ABM60998.1 anti-sigma-factor antagonist [Halorhodospira halophila SL1]MBK1729993.1 anti-sigma factor antagonist [Halorhodospira halophila]